MVIRKEESEKIFLLKNQGISIPIISKFLKIKKCTITAHCRKKSHEEELYEALPYLNNINNFRSSKGYTIGKNEFIIDILKRNINSFDSLLIIGFQHCKEIINLMDQKNKKVIAVDARSSVFSGFERIKKIRTDAVDSKFMYILDSIKYDYPNCAVYLNLTGEADLIEYIYDSNFYPIIAVTSPRGPKGYEKSSLGRSELLGFENYQISKIHLSVHE